MSKRHHFIVRTFDPFNEAAQNGLWGCTGVIENKATFKEVVVEKPHQAITALVKSDLNVTPTDPSWVVQDGAPSNSVDDVDVISFKVVTALTDKAELRRYRTEVREAIKRWAEKCRVSGLRGWRASAVKTPTFETAHDGSGHYVLKFDVYLGTKIFYSSKRLTVNAPGDWATAVRDIESLKLRLDEIFGITSGNFLTAPTVSRYFYEHSRFGRGEIL